MEQSTLLQVIPAWAGGLQSRRTREFEMSAGIDRSHRRRHGAGLALALAVSLAGTVLGVQPAQAQAWDGKGSWCVEHRTYYDCAFYSYQQCMATASGVTNVCSRNPLYVPRGKAPRAQVRPRRSRE
jgi:hypothetical protein